MPTVASTPPENGLSIECHIETQAQHQLGKPITVKGIIRNSGASALWILRWHTFLQPHCGDCLLVTHNGSPVPYIGLRVLYGKPSAESYMRIPAGGSEERQFDISELYDIREPGEYQVSFRHSVLGAAEETDAEAPRDPGRLKLAFIESEKVAFRIEGSGSGLPTTKVEAPSPSSQTILGGWPFPRNPIFSTKSSEWSDQEQKDWADAHRTAYQGTVVARNSLYAYKPEGAYRTWIENKENPGWDLRCQVVMQCITSMAAKMKDTDIIYMKSEGPPDKVAWFDPSDPSVANTIYLHASNAFDPEQLELQGGRCKRTDIWWSRALIAAHEISHLAASTQDKSYDWEQCKMFAAYNPQTAIQNALSYALYVMNTDTSTLLYEPDGKVDLKDGDLITLQANNGNYLANYNYWLKTNYIRANKATPDSGDCYFRVQKTPYPDPSSFYLIRNEDSTYLIDDGGYIMQVGDKSPREGCEFKIGEVKDHKNNKCLVLKSVESGKLWFQAGDYIMTNRDNVDQWALFKVAKV